MDTSKDTMSSELPTCNLRWAVKGKYEKERILIQEWRQVWHTNELDNVGLPYNYYVVKVWKPVPTY